MYLGEGHIFECICYSKPVCLRGNFEIMYFFHAILLALFSPTSTATALTTPANSTTPTILACRVVPLRRDARSRRLHGGEQRQHP